MNPAHDPEAGRIDGFIPLTRGVKRKIKDGMVALALANACFVRVWSHLLFDGRRFFDHQAAQPVELLALAANIFGLAALLWLGIGVWRRCRNWLFSLALSLGFLLLLVLPADFIRAQILGVTDTYVVQSLKRPMVLAALVVLMVVIVWKHRLAARVAAVVIAATLPVALLTLGKLFLVCLHLITPEDCPYAAAAPSLLTIHEGQPRVVWIIFDETDYRMAFAQRPPGLALPEFDRLRQECLSADHAYAPADMTIVSMPALIAGRRLDNVSRNGCDLALTLAGSNAVVDWAALPSVFSQARELGFNSALVGWYIPYGRLLGGSLNYCSWYALPIFEPASASTFARAMEVQVAALAWPFRFRQVFADVCRASLKDALSVAASSDYGVVLLHLPPPHAPGVYLPASNEFTCLGIGKPAGYFNNLALADHELGELRRVMEKTGQWDKSWLILSADHSWRMSKTYDGVRDYRVPFLLKPPGGGRAQTYSNQFNTVITHDLILAILRAQVTNQSAAAAWLNVHLTSDLPVKPSNATFE